jgi:hypothetical protein
MPSNEFIPSLSRKINSHAGVDNPSMRKYFLKNAATVFFAIAGLTACQPSLNWRAVQLEGTNLKFELPCKPDKTTQSVKMAGLDIDLSMVGCEANDAVWAVMTAQVPATADRVEILKGWRTATLQNMRATQTQDLTWSPSRVAALPGTLRIKSLGTSAKGQPVNAQAVWFSHLEGEAVRLVHAVVYQNQGPKMDSSAEQLIESLKLP